MKRRLGVSASLLAAILMATFGLTAATSTAGASTTKRMVKQVNKTAKQAKKARKKADRLCRTRGKKAGKRCVAARKKARKATRNARKARRKLNRHRFFDVCRHGCEYRTVQAGINDAGLWQLITRKKATVRIQPGKYVEGTFMFGSQNMKKSELPAGFTRRNFNGLTIMGADRNGKPLKDPSRVHMEGLSAKTVMKGNDPGWRPGDPVSVPAQNAIEGRNTRGVTLKNMWASNYQNNGFFIWASVDPNANEKCVGYTMDNLLASGNRAYGLFGRNCTGGKMLNSTAWNSGDSGFYIGETPCDEYTWTNHGSNPRPCQANPRWSVLDNVEAFQNTLGFSGTNAKYIHIRNSAFYNNGAGIVPNALDSEHYEPPGWIKIYRNEVFWNNYNYYCTGEGTATCGGSEFHTVSGGLGELLGAQVNFPMGVGVMLFGTDGVEVYDNDIFGNEKWGVANFSSPNMEELGVISNVGDDGKTLNNSFTGNRMGRDGVDPNQFDFLYDNTGGGNCWQDNVANPAVTWVTGTGPKTQAQLYRSCTPKPPKAYNDGTKSLDLVQGIQVKVDGELNVDPDPATILGYAGSNPPDQQECSWWSRLTSAPETGPNRFHPPFTGKSGKTYIEKRTEPAFCSL